MNLWYIERVPETIREQFIKRLTEISNELNIHPNWLMMVMFLESGVNPQAVNQTGGATGLIQFMPATAQGLGTTTTALKQMNHVQQLEFVRKYYQPYKQWLKSGEDLYLATFYPLALRKDDSYVIGSEKSENYAKLVAKQNPGFMKFHTGDTLSKKQWKNALKNIVSQKLKDDSKVSFFFQ
jgi:hypothetical protein